MRKFVSKELIVAAGLLAAPATETRPHVESVRVNNPDPRLQRLSQFLVDRDCPIKTLAPDFIQAADQNNLDWRLLPSISIIESGGGKDYRNNNVFGWDSCKQRFPSVRDGIHIVASRLANSKLYRDKNLAGVLKTYNPREDYAPRVLSMMVALSPAIN